MKIMYYGVYYKICQQFQYHKFKVTASLFL